MLADVEVWGLGCDGDDDLFFGCAVVGGACFGEREPDCGVLFDGRSNHHENQQHDEDIDERDYDHRWGLTAFASEESHGSAM